MFNPRDFLMLAEKLKNQGFCKDEAACRTIAGRAYYSVLLESREMFKKALPNPEAIIFADLTTNWSTSDCVHKLVKELFSTIDKPAHQFLKILAKLRRKSDYVLDKNVQKDDAELAGNMARYMLDEGIPRIRVKVGQNVKEVSGVLMSFRNTYDLKTHSH